MDALTLGHLRGAAAVDATDQQASDAKKIKLLTVALRTLAAQLDADATVTDTTYLATIDALTEA